MRTWRRFSRQGLLSSVFTSLLALLLTGCPTGPNGVPPNGGGTNSGDAGDNAGGDTGQPVPNDVRIEVTREGQGTVDQSSSGAIVTLTAVPDAGWFFDRWSGTTTSRENPLTIIADENTALMATFLLTPPPDADGDGVPDATDVCPSGDDRLDDDNDGLPNQCDACPKDAANDVDGDLVCGDVDNCPDAANADQADGDDDGLGDACDACPNDGDNDADADGVCGNVDDCPDTPAGESLGDNTVGCAPSQLDSDGDGVNDADDQCADTPADSQGVDVNGCILSQLDSDGDGVDDSIDACAATPSGETVDSTGCSPSQIDTDGDGVADGGDNCIAVQNADQADADTDGLGDLCDNCPNVGNVNDAIIDCNNDGDTDDPGEAVGEQCDVDGDGLGDACDNCPEVANVHIDCNNDGDTDDPGEGVGEQCDCDGDGVGDLCDLIFPCTTDNDCVDDTFFCNGAEVCGANGCCTHGGNPCAGDAICNEDDGRCDVCATQSDCDDADACTHDACVAGQCANVAVDCDDGVACTFDSCDAATGDCVSVDNCPNGQGCSFGTGTCGTMCTSTGDCAECEACMAGVCVDVCPSWSTSVPMIPNSPDTVSVFLMPEVYDLDSANQLTSVSLTPDGQAFQDAVGGEGVVILATTVPLDPNNDTVILKVTAIGGSLVLFTETMRIDAFSLAIDGSNNAIWDFDFTVLEDDFGFVDVYRFQGSQTGVVSGSTITWQSVDGTRKKCNTCDGTDDVVLPLTDPDTGWTLGTWTSAP